MPPPHRSNGDDPSRACGVLRAAGPARQPTILHPKEGIEVLPRLPAQIREVALLDLVEEMSSINTS